MDNTFTRFRAERSLFDRCAQLEKIFERLFVENLKWWFLFYTKGLLGISQARGNFLEWNETRQAGAFTFSSLVGFSKKLISWHAIKQRCALAVEASLFEASISALCHYITPSGLHFHPRPTFESFIFNLPFIISYHSYLLLPFAYISSHWSDIFSSQKIPVLFLRIMDFHVNLLNYTLQVWISKNLLKWSVKFDWFK